MGTKHIHVKGDKFDISGPEFSKSDILWPKQTKLVWLLYFLGIKHSKSGISGSVVSICNDSGSCVPLKVSKYKIN